MISATIKIAETDIELINDKPTLNPEENLERERRYWKTLSSPSARVWVNDSCVVLGRFLRAEDEVHTTKAAEMGIPVLWRTSGGGAVFHDAGNVNYSLYIPYYGTALRIEESLRLLSYPVASLLDSLGIPWEWFPPNNIYVLGKKISGSAQARCRGRLLHHGTLLVECDLEAMRSLLKPGGRSRHAPTVNLAELRPEITAVRARAALEEILSRNTLKLPDVKTASA